MTVLEMGGGKQPFVRSSRHTSFLGEHKGTHTSGGIGDFGACGGSNVTYFRRGFIQYPIDLKPPSFPCSPRSACLVWQMCGGLFWGAWDGSAPRVHNVSLISVEILMSEGSPYTKKQSHFLSPLLSNSLFHTLWFLLHTPFMLFFDFFFSSLRLSPADLHPQITRCKR